MRGSLLVVSMLLMMCATSCHVFDADLIASADGGFATDEPVAPDQPLPPVDQGPSGIGCTMGSRTLPPRPAIAGGGGDEVIFAMKNVRLDQGEVG